MHGFCDKGGGGGGGGGGSEQLLAQVVLEVKLPLASLVQVPVPWLHEYLVPQPSGVGTGKGAGFEVLLLLLKLIKFST